MKAELASCTCKKGKKFYGDILKVEDNQAKNVQQNDLHPPGSKKKSLFADSDFCCNSYSSFDSKDYKRSISADSED